MFNEFTFREQQSFCGEIIYKSMRIMKRIIRN
jgi:hypothetical protein